ncbi:MAG: DUF3078 domain-containing protein, partial [Bacteroidales bacterium]|nr:DUF3078 domain-containing protein [Bacteroidales bacterium]
FLMDSKGSAKYKKGKISWNSDYWYRLGLIKSEGLALHKNVDFLTAKSNFLHRAFSNFNYSVSAQLVKTQLFRGYKSVGDTVPTSKLLAPAVVILGMGMNYVPSKNISVNFQPLSGKFIIVIDTVLIDPTKHGLAGDQRIKGNPGAKLSVNYKALLWKTVNMKSNLTLFSDYRKKLQKVDVDWKTELSLKVNKFISTKLFFYVKYDDDAIIPFYEWKDGIKTKVGEGKKIQIQETFGVTFTYYL